MTIPIKSNEQKRGGCKGLKTENNNHQEQLSALDKARKRTSKEKERKRHPIGGKGL